MLSPFLTDDFLSPGETCIKPIEIKKKGVIGDDSEGAPKASITLKDCLACSGCITSAEAVLINSQSAGEFESRLDQALRAGDAVVVSISPESRASLAAHFSMSMEHVQLALQTVLHEWGVHRVLDTRLGELLWREESRLEAYRHLMSINKDTQQNNVSLLSSVCPGWVCYAEKAHPEVLPMMSKVRSAQQMMGVLVKRLIAQHDLKCSRVYHCSIQMCFDKKLEASRSDFADASSGARDVDTVLSTAELRDLLRRRGINDLRDVSSASCEVRSWEVSPGGLRCRSVHSGYVVEDHLRYCAKRVNEEEGSNIKIEWKMGRNGDTRDTEVRVGNTVLRARVCNGFRNIQNVVRRVGPKGKPNEQAHFVEVMACPSGCLNGGGQIRAEGDAAKEKDAAKRVLKNVEEAFAAQEKQDDVADEKLVRELYEKLVQAPPGSPKAMEMFYTDFHAVPPTTGLSVNW